MPQAKERNGSNLSIEAALANEFDIERDDKRHDVVCAVGEIIGLANCVKTSGTIAHNNVAFRFRVLTRKRNSMRQSKFDVGDRQVDLIEMQFESVRNELSFGVGLVATQIGQRLLSMINPATSLPIQLLSVALPLYGNMLHADHSLSRFLSFFLLSSPRESFSIEDIFADHYSAFSNQQWIV